MITGKVTEKLFLPNENIYSYHIISYHRIYDRTGTTNTWLFGNPLYAAHRHRFFMTLHSAVDVETPDKTAIRPYVYHKQTYISLFLF